MSPQAETETNRLPADARQFGWQELLALPVVEDLFERMATSQELFELGRIQQLLGINPHDNKTQYIDPDTSGYTHQPHISDRTQERIHRKMMNIGIYSRNSGLQPEFLSIYPSNPLFRPFRAANRSKMGIHPTENEQVIPKTAIIQLPSVENPPKRKALFRLPVSARVALAASLFSLAHAATSVREVFAQDAQPTPSSAQWAQRCQKLFLTSDVAAKDGKFVVRVYLSPSETQTVFGTAECALHTIPFSDQTGRQILADRPNATDIFTRMFQTMRVTPASGAFIDAKTGAISYVNPTKPMIIEAELMDIVPVKKNDDKKPEENPQQQPSWLWCLAPFLTVGAIGAAWRQIFHHREAPRVRIPLVPTQAVLDQNETRARTARGYGLPNMERDTLTTRVSTENSRREAARRQRQEEINERVAQKNIATFLRSFFYYALFPISMPLGIIFHPRQFAGSVQMHRGMAQQFRAAMLEADDLTAHAERLGLEHLEPKEVREALGRIISLAREVPDSVRTYRPDELLDEAARTMEPFATTPDHARKLGARAVSIGLGFNRTRAAAEEEEREREARAHQRADDYIASIIKGAINAAHDANKDLPPETIEALVKQYNDNAARFLYQDNED